MNQRLATTQEVFTKKEKQMNPVKNSKLWVFNLAYSNILLPRFTGSLKTNRLATLVAMKTKSP